LKSDSIGIFDSGVGGVTVIKELINVLPDENYLYFGDTARVPYGEKTEEELVSFSREILNWFKTKNVKMVLMACNTSSAVTLKVVQNEYDFPIIGLIEPTAEYISKINVKKVGLMATTATVNSKSYTNSAEKYGIKIVDVACPGLVEIVESGKISTVEAKEKISPYLKKLLDENVEKIILGCTHYPFLENDMIELGCESSMFINPAECLVQKALEVLQERNLKNHTGGSVKYFVSANPDNFVKNAQKLVENCDYANLIDLKRPTK
jgi:glutamate racemase